MSNDTPSTSSPFEEGIFMDILFLPMPLSMLWCSSSGKFFLMSDLRLPCCTFFSLFVTTLQDFQIVIRGFHSTGSQCETAVGAPRAGGLQKQGLSSRGPGLRLGCAEPPDLPVLGFRICSLLSGLAVVPSPYLVQIQGCQPPSWIMLGMLL